jgi:GMP synthase (glutamine-hydrolysing)
VDEVIRRIAETQHGIVGRRQLSSRGIGRHELFHRIDEGMLVPLSPEVLRLAGAPVTEGSIAIAGVLDSPGHAFLAYRSAAAWWGLPGFSIQRPVHTVFPWQGTRIRRRLAIVHFHRGLAEGHLRTLSGVPVVSTALTIFLLAGSEHAGRTERALDNAWSMGLVTHRQMHELLQLLAARGRNGIRVMRKLLADRPADYVAPQTGLEGRVGRLARDVGVVPRRQINTGGDEWVGRVDFLIEDTNKAIEVLSQRYHGSLLDRRAKMKGMRLGLLVCDHVRPEFLGISGDYPDMFRRLFDGHDDVELVVYDAIDGELPADSSECDAWITTGSRHSVNDDEPWIRRLEEFVRDVARADVPFIGICFGHQLIAKALGGTVVQSDRGWGVGMKDVEVRDDLGLGSSYRVLNSHQDQVATLPPGAEILGWSDDCPVSMLGVGETMVGIQGHPEFELEYSKALMEARRGSLIPGDTVEAGLATLDSPPDSGLLADWILAFVSKPRPGDNG